MSEFRRRLFFAQAAEEPIILPDGYTKYDYIQGDGTAYIDTTINTAEEQALEVIVNYLATSKNNAKFIGADLVNAGRFRIGGWGVFAGRIGGWYHNGSSNAYTDDAKGIKSQITFQGSNGAQTLTVKQGGAIVRQRTDTKAYVSGYTSHILVGSNPDAKIYRAKVYSDYDATTLVFDGIPCIDPNGVRGMYDLVSETFFSNAAGSGTFSLGFDNHVPQGYREVEWVGANKDAQIAFSITSLATLKEEIRVKWTNLSGRQIMGLESGSGYWGYDGSKYEIAALSTGIAPTGGWDDLVITRTNNGIDCTINGTSISRLAKMYSAATNFNLFKVYGMGCACQIAEYKIGDGVTLYHDLVPCVRMSDNQPGFYDILQGKFHAGGTSVGAFVNS